MALQQFSTELHLLVAYHLSTAESGKLHRRNLLAMALTSQSWFRPAIEYLWKEVVGFEPILRCLPGDIWEKDQDVYHSNGELDWNSRVPSRRVCSEDLARFDDVYSRLIKSFIIAAWPSRTIIEHLTTAAMHSRDPVKNLIAPRIRGTLIPNLRALSFGCVGRGDANDYLHHLPHLASKTLQNLEFYYPGSASVPLTGVCLSEAFDEIVTGCPTLKEVRLRTQLDLAHLSLSRLVRGVVTKSWRHCLHTLEVKSLTNSDLKYLSSLSNLRTLRLVDLGPLNCNSECDPDAPTLRSQYSAFPGLKEVRVETTHPQDDSPNIVALLQYLSPENTPLTTLYLQSDVSCSSLAAWADIISAISAHCNPNSLTSLSLGDNLQGDVKYTYDIRPNQYLDLTPLFKFRNMAKFWHHVEDSQPIRGGDLKAMVSMWTELRQLQLPRWSDPRVDSDRMDCDDLLYLVHTLPHLSSLSVSVDMDEIPFGMNKLNIKPILAPLESLEFVNSEVTSLVVFMEFYTAFFQPIPELIHTMGFEEIDLWEEAVTLVREIRSGELDVNQAILGALRWKSGDDSVFSLNAVLEERGKDLSYVEEWVNHHAGDGCGASPSRDPVCEERGKDLSYVEEWVSRHAGGGCWEDPGGDSSKLDDEESESFTNTAGSMPLDRGFVEGVDGCGT